MKWTYSLIVGTFFLHITVAQNFAKHDLKLLERFITDPEAQEEEPKYVCTAVS